MKYLVFLFGSLLAGQTLEYECLVELSTEQYRGLTTSVWGKQFPRADVEKNPALFRAYLPGARKFEWVIPTLPTKGTEAWNKIQVIGAERWAVAVPQDGTYCNSKSLSGGQAGVVSITQPNGWVYGGQVSSSPSTATGDNKKLFQQINLLERPISRNKDFAVVVIDSGVSVGSWHLRQRMSEGLRFSRSFVGADRNEDTGFHGTAVASLISGHELGVSDAPIVSFQVLKTYTSDGQSFSAGREVDTLRAILALHDLPHKRLVVNLSLSYYGQSRFWHQAMSSLGDRALFVAGAGNSGQPVPKGSPWAPCSIDLPNTICVGGLTDDNRKASFSNYGQAVSLSAPAESVLAGLPDGRMARLSGTSFASPLVSGAAALVLGEKDLPSSEIKSRLLGGARFEPKLWEVMGAPLRLDVAGALKPRVTENKIYSISGVVGTFTGEEYRFAYSDLVTITGKDLCEENFKAEVGSAMPTQVGKTQVLLNGRPVQFLSASADRLDIVLPSVFSGAYNTGALVVGEDGSLTPNPLTNILLVVRVDDDGNIIKNSVQLARRFEVRPVSFGLAGFARHDQTLVSDRNPLRGGEEATAFLTGVEYILARGGKIAFSFGDVEVMASVEKTEAIGLYTAKVLVPKGTPAISGGLFGQIRDPLTGAEKNFGVNYSEE